MSAHARLRRSAAVALVSAITAGTALLLTACDPSTDTGTDHTGTPTPAATPSAPAVPSATPSTPATTTPTTSATATPTASTPSATPSTPATTTPTASATPTQTQARPQTPALNLTKGTGLTISNGTRYVIMDGKSVDFGTIVRDLAWSPDGKHAAFIDGNGNLQTADPDGTHKTLVAKAPTGTTWSHPTWQVFVPNADDQRMLLKPKNNLQFTANDHGTLRLLTIPATGATNPTELSLGQYAGEDEKPNPTTGNQWANVAGRVGTSVYANKDDGQVYIRDEYLRQNGGPIAKGSQPDLSDDNHELVFVRSVNGHDHLFTQDQNTNANAVDLTPNATVDYTQPAFSPDGKTIAFRGPDGTYTIPTKGGTPTKVSDTTGLPAYRG
ncbi:MULTISPECIES: PD40 domain-containing protein [Kitasatospora]|uniref:WD40 repeat protein n=1 Tax=Kitasatospora setae (strain ATCC 33774 / DSM 43861 / JCM 3304 / KCC A-0304 / NBRC 14216 / KM-6054) TaxID=452652 RepID=E4NE82_KITSK|nr:MULTISPECIES: PD40 domain-containing protein [Kitasatospora]BAJ29513.1 hypothetical protein KSE_37110 [Kitasatospora setae KM-6054]